MKNIYCLLIVSFLCIFSLLPAGAQTLSEKDFQVLNMNDGLSDNDIHSVAKDTEGFMWFGTGSGLNRYDGRTFKVFRMPGISYRRIDRVVSLDTDYLLLRSEQNLFLFDKKYERFLPVCDSVSKQPVMFADLVADSDGSCWGVSSGELSEVNFPSSFVQDTAFVSVRHVVNNSQSDPFVVLCMGEDGKMLYCASRNGTVYRFTPGQRQLKKVCDGQLSSGRWVSSLLNDDSFIWIPTVGDGLYGYDLTNGKLHHWQYISERMGEQLSHNDVFRLLPIGNSRYLAVTWNGYTLLSLTPERAIKLRDFQSFIHNGKQYFETRMISGYYDEEGLLWIGTEGGGVLFSDLRQLFYHQYAQTRSNEICGIQMDEDGYVWLATFHKGVLRSTQPFDVSHSLSFESFDTGIPGLKTVLCSSPDKNGGFWFGTQDGRVLRYGKDRKWDDMRIGTLGQPSPVVWSLLMVSDEQCWAGTSDGLYWVDFQRGTSTHIGWSNPQIPDHIHIRALAAGDNQTLWLGTGRGLLRLWMSGTKVLRTHAGYEARAGMPDTEIEVRALLYGTDKKLWAGYAGSGLVACSPEGDKMFSTKDVQVSWASTLVETYSLRRTKESIDNNFKLTSDFLLSLGDRYMKDGKDDPRGYLWINVSSKQICNYIEHFEIADTSRIKMNLEKMSEYIQSCVNEHGELKFWRVILRNNQELHDNHHTNSDKSVYYLANGILPGICTNRTRVGIPEQDDNVYNLKNYHLISGPKDEFIDMDILGEDLTKALDETIEIKKELHAKNPNVKEWDKKYPSPTLVRQKYRSPNNPLLIIYPLNPEKANVIGFDGKIKQDVECFNQNDTPFIGFAIVFPNSKNSKGVKYKVNEVKDLIDTEINFEETNDNHYPDEE